MKHGKNSAIGGARRAAVSAIGGTRTEPWVKLDSASAGCVRESRVCSQVVGEAAGGGSQPWERQSAPVLRGKYSWLSVSFLIAICQTFPGKQVDQTACLKDANCYWQSTSSGEIVHRASFLDFWWALI